MKRFECFQYAAAAVAGLGLLLPSGVLAADASRAAVAAGSAEGPAILDVGLGDGGKLAGQVLNAQGEPLAETMVTVRCSGVDVASAITDAGGSFSARGLTGGVYEVNAAGGSGMFRLWTANASPPSAQSRVLIVAGQQVSRGQGGRAQPLLGPTTKTKVIVGTVLVGGIVGGIVAWAVSEHKSSS